jgi:phage terminase large subunit-like protein
MRDYPQLAADYVQAVRSGARPACKWERLAVERHVRDIARSEAGDPDFPYVFNPELLHPTTGKPYRPGSRFCQFAELMPHIKGDWAGRGELIRLEPWEAFAGMSLFGWVHRETGKRRFRKGDLFVPRKNAKSTLAALVGLYMLSADGEFGAEVYSGATSKDQALEVFRPARLMAQTMHEYRARFGVLVNVSNLAVLDTNSKFEPLIGKPGDGASPSCAIHDEYHEHATSDQYDTMATGMGARSQPLQLVITTAGSNIGGPCYTHQVELQKILEGLVTDDRRWGIIYSVDPGDDWTDPAILLKANPNLGISIDEESLVADQAEAVRDPRKAAVFRTKRLNVWVNSAHPWLNLESLQKGADPTLTLDQFRGEHCWVGLDLASKTDIASKANVFRREVAGEWHYYVITRNWLPEAAVQKPENEHYRAWVQQGHLVQTPGNMIDLRLIQDDVEVGAEHHLVAEIAMDAWGSREIAPALQQSGFTVVDVPMTTRHLSEPMKLIAALVDAGRLHHDGNLASTWMFSNVECVEDRNGNIFPRKAKPELKIDAAIATILAIGRAIAGGDQAVVPQIISFDLTPA